MLLNKLPETYQHNTVMAQIAKLIEDKKIISSSSVYSDNGKLKVFIKKSGKPIFDKDRPIYSMIRAMSKTIITTGKFYLILLDANLKSEKDTFKVPFARGDKEI